MKVSVSPISLSDELHRLRGCWSADDGDATNLFNKLCALARVPTSQRDAFDAKMAWLMDLTWHQHFIRTVVAGDLRDEAFLNAEGRLREALDAIAGLSKFQREYLGGALLGIPEGPLLDYLKIAGIKWPEMLYHLMMIFHALAGKAPTQPRAKRKVGRQPHAIANWPFQGFVRALYLVCEENGGKLGFDPKTGKGRMSEALDLLRPRLPSLLLPNALPGSTIRACIKAAKNPEPLF